MVQIFIQLEKSPIVLQFVMLFVIHQNNPCHLKACLNKNMYLLRLTVHHQRKNDHLLTAIHLF